MTWQEKDLIDFKLPLYFFECRTQECPVVLFDPKRNFFLPGFCPLCNRRGERIVG